MCRVMDDPCVLLRECGLIPSGWQLVVAAGSPVRRASLQQWRAPAGVVLFRRRQEAAAFAGSSEFHRRRWSCLPTVFVGVPFPVGACGVRARRPGF